MTEDHSTSPQIHPLPDEDWDASLLTVFTQLGTPLNIHRLLANHPQLLLAWMPFRNYIVAHSSLSPRHRELIILRHAWISDTNYEWTHHVLRGRGVGLTAQDFAAIKVGPDDRRWDPSESLLLRAVDELFKTSAVDSQTWQSLALHFSAVRRLDVIFTIGVYQTLSMLIHTNGIEMD